MNEKLGYNDPTPESYDAAPAEGAQEADAQHRARHESVNQSVNEPEKALTGWTDGQDADVERLRRSLEHTNPELLHKLDAGIDTDQEQWHKDDTELMATYMRVTLDHLADTNPDLDRQGVANAAAWAAFQQLHEDLENETRFDSPGSIGPVEKHNLKTFLHRAQNDYATAMADPDLSNREAVDTMQKSYQEAITAAAGDVETFRPMTDLSPSRE